MHDDVSPISRARRHRLDFMTDLASETPWRVPVSPRVELRVLEAPAWGMFAVVLVDGLPVTLVDGVEC